MRLTYRAIVQQCSVLAVKIDEPECIVAQVNPRVVARQPTVGETDRILGQAAQRCTVFTYAEHRALGRAGVRNQSQRGRALWLGRQDDRRALTGHRWLITTGQS